MERKGLIYERGEIFPTHIVLNPKQREAVRGILMNITSAPLSVRVAGEKKLLETLENWHPLNRLILDSKGEVEGFIACKGYKATNTTPRILFIEGFGTTENTGRNLLEEIPAFLKSVQDMGYKNISFTGWNERLNHILERYDFKKDEVEKVEGYEVDYYTKVLY